MVAAIYGRKDNEQTDADAKPARTRAGTQGRR
jgi:hypothetical protein